MTSDTNHPRAPRRALQQLLPKTQLLLCAGLLFSSLQAQGSYEQLIEQARAGDYQPALNFLRSQPDPSSARYRQDHLLIASWAGEDAEVVEHYERWTKQRDWPADILAVVARSYRNLQRWPQALATYQRGLVLSAGHQGLLLGQLLTLADAGQSARAIELGRALVAQAPSDAERRLALAYAYQRAGQPHAALFELDQARDLAPGHAEVVRAYGQGLQHSGLVQPALELLARHPELFDAAQQRQLQGDLLAQRVRMADLATRRESERFMIADRALADADALLQQWAGLPEARRDHLRLRIDRLGALHARVRMAELIEAYQQLQQEQVTLPAYALRWVAAAFLYLRQPEQAASLYRQVLAGENPKHPDWLNDQRSLFFALVESEQLDEARALAEQLAASEPPRLFLPGNAEAEPNGRWLEAQELLASAYLFGNDTPAAQQALAELAENAPNNAALRTSRAGLYLARGWARHAEDELKVVESLAPRNLALEVEQGMAALALQEWRQLQLLADDVIARYPENLRAQRLERLRQVHEMAELRLSGYRGLGAGGDVSGSHELGIDSLLYSAPLAHDWRLFGGAGYGSGEFAEGRAQHRWQRAGLDWRVRNHSVEAELSSHDYGHGQQLGLRLSGSHDLDDHWQYGWSAQRLSTATPLRALNADIRADSLDGYLRWRADERREWRLSASAAHFSDGNQRLGLQLDGSERLHTAAHWQLDAGLALGLSHNSGSDQVPYYNPGRELSLVPQLQWSQVLYRRYQTQWSQQLQVGLGSTVQQGHGAAALGQIGYGQRLRLDDRFDGGLMLSALSRTYDGEREQQYRLQFDLRYRF